MSTFDSEGYCYKRRRLDVSSSLHETTNPNVFPRFACTFCRSGTWQPAANDSVLHCTTCPFRIDLWSVGTATDALQMISQKMSQHDICQAQYSASGGCNCVSLSLEHVGKTPSAFVDAAVATLREENSIELSGNAQFSPNAASGDPNCGGHFQLLFLRCAQCGLQELLL